MGEEPQVEEHSAVGWQQAPGTPLELPVQPSGAKIISDLQPQRHWANTLPQGVFTLLKYSLCQHMQGFLKQVFLYDHWCSGCLPTNFFYHYIPEFHALSHWSYLGSGRTPSPESISLFNSWSWPIRKWDWRMSGSSSSKVVRLWYRPIICPLTQHWDMRKLNLGKSWQTQTTCYRYTWRKVRLQGNKVPKMWWNNRVSCE